MNAKRNVEVFSAGCPVCDATIELIHDLACPSCSVTVLDTNDPTIARRAASLGVRSVPAVAVDGKLVVCCAAGGVDEQALREAGIGSPCVQ